ncbi:hypothetical protein [Sorangium cellulosum]|uniref:Uncharacterized protein n=1 Tax=Sorangium cellulosum So0157-2 TaxID=1254432 RepID=S4Y5K0_SORCE|nr:hypothetical protein [Sorangium cellulosum]AGP39470.1 hypothetical protein SCE1572_36285 [Sorangium cellulosum So0157-2]
MWRIRGQGDAQIKLLDVCRPVQIHCSIRGAARPHPATGRHLHALYVVDVGKIRPAVVGLGGEDRDSSMQVEFDLNGQIHLNLPGSLYLTGGSPEETYELSASLSECGSAVPSWHPLTTLVTGARFVVPAYHSRVRSADLGVRFRVGGNAGRLDHTPIHVTGDAVMDLNDGPEPVINLTHGGGISGLPPTGITLISEWWG